jgi:hypothetical protein
VADRVRQPSPEAVRTQFNDAHFDAGLEPFIWTPNPKQEQFLAADDYEVLFGGAAGGGKSDALLIDALCLQHDAPNNKNHRAIIFRRTYRDLTDLIDRAKELYPLIVPGTTYNSNDHVFDFPSGAKVFLSHLQHDKHRLNHRGRAYNYIAFDELTLWASNVCWEYLKTRNRTTDRTLPCYMRATTNPDGPGQLWVMEHWGIEEEGKATYLEQSIETEVFDEVLGEWVYLPMPYGRRFIPAKLSDNEHLRGTGYRERLMMLDPDTRDALLRGLWRENSVKGSYYFKVLQKARAENRICRLAHAKTDPVNTFWDLGFNDQTAIWFHQHIARENRFINAYQNSGEAIDHYAQVLADFAREEGYVYGTHYLPHDAQNKTVHAGKSVLQILTDLMPGANFQVVPRIERVQTGIQQARAAFASCYFDAEKCRDGLAALQLYRKKWNNATNAFTHEPLHDDNSNYADAFRQFAQGFEGARIVIDAYEPEFKKKARALYGARAGAPKHPALA